VSAGEQWRVGQSEWCEIGSALNLKWSITLYTCLKFLGLAPDESAIILVVLVVVLLILVVVVVVVNNIPDLYSIPFYLTYNHNLLLFRVSGT
jgi:hypothetical protein